MKKFKSIAKWDPCIGKHFPNNETTDRHNTKEEAEAVCRLLKKEGFGGRHIYFPIETRVEEIMPCCDVCAENRCAFQCGDDNCLLTFHPF